LELVLLTVTVSVTPVAFTPSIILIALNTFGFEDIEHLGTLSFSLTDQGYRTRNRSV